MNVVSIVVLGVITGAATAMWAIPGIWYWARRYRWAGAGYITVGVANFVSTSILFQQIRDPLFEVAPGLSLALLLILLGLPPLLVFGRWVHERRLLP